MRHLTVQQLSASLDGALVGVSLELVVRHLHSCRECRDRHARLAKQDDALRRLLAGDPGQAFVEDLAIRIEAIVDAEANGRTPPPVRTTPVDVQVAPMPGPQPYATIEPRAVAPVPEPFVVPEPPLAAARAVPPKQPPVFTVAARVAATPPPPRAEPAAPVPPMALVPVAPAVPQPPKVPVPARPERILTVATPRTEIVLPPSAQAPPAAAAKPSPRPAPPSPVPPTAEVPAKASPAELPVKASLAEPPQRVRVRRAPGDHHRARFALVSVAALVAVYIGLLVLPPVIRIPVPDLPVPRLPRFELVHPRPRPTETRVTTATAPPTAISSAPIAPATEKAPPVPVPAPVMSRSETEQPPKIAHPAAAAVVTRATREPVVNKTPQAGTRPPRVEQAPVRAPALAATAPAGDADDDWPLLCGEVLDESGAPVAGARVLLADLDLTARTDKRGRFCIAAPAGDRTLSVQALGFSAHRQVVSLGTATLELRISLQSGH